MMDAERMRQVLLGAPRRSPRESALWILLHVITEKTVDPEIKHWAEAGKRILENGI